MRINRVWGFVLAAAVVATGCARWETRDRDERDRHSGFDAGPGGGSTEPFPGRDAGAPPLPPSLEGASISAEEPPPPISGGTLLALSDGRLVVSDPDRDRIVVVSTTEAEVRATFELEDGDEPGRAVEDADGRVHVALRRGGEVFSFHPDDTTSGDRRAVCAMPRGIAFEASTGLLHVACRGGELVSLPAAGGARTRTLELEQDLRDVMVTATGLALTTFRSAELLRLSPEGTVLGRSRPLPRETRAFEGDSPLFEPAVAWRTRALPDGSYLMAHQRATSATVETAPGGYGGHDECRGGGVVQGGATVFSAEGAPSPANALSPSAVLPVDIAADPITDRVAVITATTDELFGFGNVLVYTREVLTTEEPCLFPPESRTVEGQTVAAAYVDGELWVQTREPARVVGFSPSGSETVVGLGGEDVTDTGHHIFHMDAGGGVACASCHAEGGDDGRVWHFAGLGPRRTQTMEGGILGTEPFHWSGDMADLDMLVHEVFTGRMSGPALREDHVEALGGWMDGIPAAIPSTPEDAAAVDRGRALFEHADIGCADCHNGPLLTNNSTVDVGTGEPMQVPRLVGIAVRAPFLHTGCAETLVDRFDPECGGGDFHGVTSHLTDAEIADLVAYLETL